MVHLNRAGLIYGESAPAGGPNVQKRLRHLARLHQFGGESAVDLGCGKGSYLAEIARWYERVVGVDILPENLLLAKRNLLAKGLQRNSLVCASAENLCLPDKCCDAVFLIEVLDHIPSVSSCLEEALRILRPGGVCYITVPNRFFPLETHPVRLLGKFFHPAWFPLLPWIKPLHARMATARVFSKREIKRLANLTGFNVIGISAMYPPLEHRGSPKSRRLMTWLENTRLQGFGSSLLAVIQKPSQDVARARVRPVAQAQGPADSLSVEKVRGYSSE